MGFAEEFVLTQAKTRFCERMKKHTSFGVGGEAKYFAEADSLFSLNQIMTLAAKYKVPYKVIGNGTNVLFSDAGYDGLVISLKGLTDVFFVRDEVRAMAGAPLEKVIKFSAEHNLSGLESLSGIPATVGGAVAMNAGAFGRAVSDKITMVETLYGGKIKRYDKADCAFGYRKSRFLGKKQTIVSATFSLEEGDRETISAAIKSFAETRKRIQPTGKNCGSVFKNPKGVSAGELIDRAKMKGLSLGGATVSEKHANFICVDSRATASDVYDLIKTIKEKVFAEFGITLEEEVEFVGEF